ncbi:uncharacterized protein LOC108907140 [Anoplophora glabripennis]|uniref:uncharacterized protein LOC108907140 n=1 Tax=Anoplophora glabripennis TaxID=217634 RepID=UPI0008746647|nr:uncharacterized protein LOC108907140 [Anoplophora glabripennis]
MSNDIHPQVRQTLEQLLNGGEGDLEIVSHDPNKKGEGFSGAIVFVTLRDKRTRNELNVIVKQAYRGPSVRELLQRDVFINETYFYTKVWSRLDKFQERIPEKCRFQKVPKCLASDSNESIMFLVMENLKLQHFHNHVKKVLLDREHYELIFKEYGKFHGISFAYKALHPEKYVEMAEGLVNMYSILAKKHFYQNSIKYAYEICAESLQPGVDDAVIEKLRHYLQNYKGIFLEIAEAETKYAVITHGDCWSSNMMFKYNDSKKVTDVRFFDFQFARSASPCCDLSYCLYSGASKEVLKDLDYLLQIYHDSLSETLKQFGCDSDKLFPMQALKEDWKRFCKLALTMSLMVWRVKFVYEEEWKDNTDEAINVQEQIIQSGYDETAFNKTVRDLLYHLHENDFL